MENKNQDTEVKTWEETNLLKINQNSHEGEGGKDRKYYCCISLKT